MVLLNLGGNRRTGESRKGVTTGPVNDNRVRPLLRGDPGALACIGECGGVNGSVFRLLLLIPNYLRCFRFVLYFLLVLLPPAAGIDLIF